MEATTSIPSAEKGFGLLAGQCGYQATIKVMQSRAGFYIGTSDEHGFPLSRESVEYFDSETSAETALAQNRWTQRLEA